MKTKILALGLCAALLAGCNVHIGSDADATPAESEAAIEQYVGAYRYDYEYDTPEQKEDHYIVLADLNGTLSGWYYGTSDDFDEAREGYPPGYYVTDMRDLIVRDGAFSFRIELDDGEVFSKPVDLTYRSSTDVRLDENPLWEYKLRKRENNFAGTITGTEIRLVIGDEERIFKKMQQ